MSREMQKMASVLMVLGLLLTTVLGVPNVVTAATGFPDLNQHWAAGYINNWTNEGLVGGYEDGTFRPNNPITKAEFIVLVNRVMGYNDVTEIDFPDVPAGAWYRGDVVKSQAIGYSHAYADGTFGPNKPLSREEAAVMIYRIMKLENVEVEDVLASFSDANKIDPDYKEALNAVVDAGYLGGYPDKTVRPKQTTTRAEMIVILDRIAGQKYRTAGTFGPAEGEEVIKTNVTVSKTDITLRNMVIEGDLYITEGVGDGDCYLDNVVVKGRTLVSGGGTNSIFVANLSDLGSLEVNSATQPQIHVVFMGNYPSQVPVMLRTGAMIQAPPPPPAPTGPASILPHLIIAAGSGRVVGPQQFDLQGNIGSVVIPGGNDDSPAQLNLGEGANVGTLNAGAAGSQINMSGGQLGQLNLNAPTNVNMISGGIGRLMAGPGATGSEFVVGDDAEIGETELGDDTTIIVNGNEVTSQPSTPTPTPGGDTGGGDPYVPTPTPSRVSAISVTTVPADVSELDNAAEITVTLSTTTSGASIYYTLDGSSPTSSSTKYTVPFTVQTANPEGETIAVKAIGIRSGYTNSAVATKAIVFKAQEIDPSEAAKAAFLAGLKTAVSSDVAEVEIEDESISVTFAHGASVNAIKDAANALVGQLVTDGVSGTLTLGSETFTLEDADVGAIASALLNGVEPEDFLTNGFVKVDYEAAVTVDGVPFTLKGELTFQMGEAQ